MVVCVEQEARQKLLVRARAAVDGPRTFIARAACNDTGGNDDDERPINGHTAVSRYRSELCITDLSGAGEKSPGARASGMLHLVP